MACVQTTPEKWQSIHVLNTTVTYIWFTGWVPCVGLDKVKALLFRKNAGQYVQTQVAYQTAEKVITDPSAPGVLGTAQTGNGSYNMSLTDIATTTDGEMYIRFGVAACLTQGNPDRAEVGLQLCTEVYGTIVSTRTLDLVTPDTGSYDVPVTDWLPSTTLTKSKSVLNIMNASATFQCRVAYRTAATRIENPSAWTSQDTFHTSGSVNTGELSASTTDFWIQFGIEHQNSSGTNQSAQVTVVTGVRK